MGIVLYWLYFNNQARYMCINQHFSIGKLAGYWTVQTTIKRINIIIIIVIIINLDNDIVSKTYTDQRWEGIPIMFYFLMD